MLDKSLLGRYELVDPSKNHNKFWHIVFNATEQKYISVWGRIGKGSPPSKEYSSEEAEKKVKEKIKKGYKKVAGHEEVIGCNSIHFIKSILG